MSGRLALLVALCTLALCPPLLSNLALAQDDADISPKFRRLITPEEYHRLRNQHLNLLRGLPADPSLREAAVRTRDRQISQRNLEAPSGPAVFSPGAWASIGPNPIPNGQVTGALAVGGRVTAFAIDPANTNKVYLGTAQGGVYRSIDGGTNWTQIFDTASTSAIGSLALAPSNSTILFVGTGEANGSGDSYAGVGMYRIDNCDTTATLVGPINPLRNYTDTASVAQSFPIFNGRSISSILVHPTDPSIVYAGVAGGVIGIGGDIPFGGTPPRGLLGLVRLTNATSPAASVAAQKLTVTTAASLDLPNTGNRSVNSLFFDPSDPNIVAVWISGNAAAGDGGIYRSTNAQAANPTFTQVLVTATAGVRGEFAGYKEGANPTVIYAATGEGGTGRLRRSVDGGGTWSAAIAGGTGFCGGQCFYNIGLDVRPGVTTATTDDVVVLGGNVANTSPPTRLFAKSTSGGATFTESSAGLHADAHFIRFDPANSNIIWHGNDGGVFKSTNGGSNWASLNNSQLNTVQFSSLSVHPTIEKWAIGGTQDNGTNMRKGDGSWLRVDFGDGGYALIDRNATDETNITLYHTYFNQTSNFLGFGRILSSACAHDTLAGIFGWSFRGIYSGSVDPTANCDSSDLFNGILLSDMVLFYAPMELGPGNPNTVYFGAGAVYRSANKGNTMPAVSQSSATSPISTIAVSPQDDNYRIFGRRDGSIFYTTTGANPMTALAGIPAKFVARAKFDPSNKNTAYIALGGYFGGTTVAQSHIWKIANLNTTPAVTALNSGLPDIPVNAFAIDPDDGNNLFAGTDIGVYGSSDGGANWTPYGSDLPVVAVFGMEIQPTSRTLRIATHGRGVWKIGLPPLPDLTVTKTHAGNFSQGQTGATYTVTVNNSGLGDKRDADAVSLTDTPPPGLTITAMSGSGWICTILPTCTRSDVLAGGTAYPPLTITVSVAGNATSPQANSVTVSTSATESDTGNNTATDSTTILVLPDLTVTKSHAGNFALGQIGARYTATVINSGGGDKPAGSAVLLVETPPSGLQVIAMSGTGWNCSVLPTCTRSDVLAAGQSYPPLTIMVTVAGNATSPQTNSVTVSTTAAESSTGNNTTTDPTTIVAGSLGSLTVTAAGSGTGIVTSQDGGIICGATCTSAYVNGSNITLSAGPVSGSVFTGWLGRSCTGTGTCVVPISGATAVSATFALSSGIGPRILDIDANNQYDRLTDGLMVLRYLFGLSGAAVTTGAVGALANRTDPTQIGIYLNDIRPYLDADGDGAVDALTDGVLIIRDLFGLTGTALTQGAIGAAASRTTGAAVQSYLGTLKP